MTMISVALSSNDATSRDESGLLLVTKQAAFHATFARFFANSGLAASHRPGNTVVTVANVIDAHNELTTTKCSRLSFDANCFVVVANSVGQPTLVG
jgi:hypothetical protein